MTVDRSDVERLRWLAEKTKEMDTGKGIMIALEALGLWEDKDEKRNGHCSPWDVYCGK